MARSLSSGRRIHPLKLQHPVGEKVSNGDGEYAQDYATYAEPFGAVEPATAQRLERITLDAAIATASHLVTIPFVQGVAVQDWVIYSGRKLTVLGYADPEERHVELILVCQELKP